jgi:hypothetical protein
MIGTRRQSISSSTAVWRVALLVLAVALGLTNFVELAATFRPGYWDHVGLIGDGFMLINRKPSLEAYRPDEIDVLGFAIQQIGLDLTALEREQYKQQASELEALASTARSSADEMRTLLQLALGRHAIGAANSPVTTSEGMAVPHD